MKESYKEREEYLRMLSGLELLSDLYIRKPVRKPHSFRAALSRSVFAPILKPLNRLIDSPATPMKSPHGDLQLNLLGTTGRAPLYFSDEEIAVYTVLFGAGDRIRDPLVAPDNIHYFAVTDQELNRGSLWQQKNADTVIPEKIRKDPLLCSRWCKMHPEMLFPDHNVSVYLDANILITSDLTPLIAGLRKYPVTMFRHRTRDCAYQEIRACCSQKKAPIQMLMRDKKRLESRGLPKHWGLLEAPVIARRHHDSLCRQIMDEWWNCYAEGSSRRDQIALMDCLWQLQIPPEQIGILGSNVRATGMFIQLSHIDSPKTRHKSQDGGKWNLRS